MATLILFFLIFGSIRATDLRIPFSLDFHSIRAEYVRNSDIKLDFYCTAVTETCKIEFKNAPLPWKISQNSLTMNPLEQKSSKVVRSWNLDIQVTENKNNFYSQPVRITIQNNQIIVEKVYSLIKEDETSNIKRLSTKRILQNIGDPMRVIKVLTPQNSANSLPNGFGLPSDNSNPLLSSLISSSNSPSSNRQPQPQPQPVTPESIQFQNRKQQALRNQVSANKKIQNLLASIKRLKQDLVRMKSQTQVTKKKTEQLRAISEKCGNDLFFYQNTIAKIQNAIKDRQNKIEQLRPASNKLQIEQQTKRLKQLEQEKIKIEWDSATNQSLLSSLQKQLDNCRDVQKRNSKVLYDANNQLSKNQIDIQKLRSQVSTTKANLSKINSDLSDVRSIISNLEQRLKDARQRQSNLVKQKATFEQSLSNSSDKLSSLEADSKSISLQTANLSDPNPCSRQESKVRATQNDIDNGKRLAGQNQINLSRQKLTVESVTKIVNPDNATLTLKNEIDLLKKQLIIFNDNFNKTSPICDANFQNYTKMAVQLNKNYSSLQQANNTISGINDDLIQAQKSLDDAKINLAQILREQFTYLNRKGGNVILPTLPQINTTLQNNYDFNSTQAVPNVTNVPVAPAVSVNASTNSSDKNRTPKLIVSDPSVLNLLKKDENSQSPNPPSPPNQPNPNSNPNPRSPPSNQPSPPSNQLNPPSPPPSQAVPQQPISNPVTQSNPNIVSNPAPRNNIQSNPTPATSTSSTGDQFRITSKLGFKQVLTESLKTFLSSIGIQNIGTLTKNKFLYTLDDSTLKNLTFINSFTPITYSKFECTNPNVFDQGVVLEQVRPGVILLMNNKSKIQFRLSLGECTKIISTSPSNALKQGTTVFFSGVSTVSIPGNMLLNAHSIICNPQQQ